jgi:hypothetical protein
MPNVVKSNDALKAESKLNKQPETPVKTTVNDALKNTAEEPGLNQAVTSKNELEPGTERAEED